MRLKRALVLLELCACNRILGLGDLDVRTYVDAPADAQPGCPPIGGMPTFGSRLYEYVDQYCLGYQTSDTVAIAQCNGGPTNFEPAQGAPGQLLTPIALPQLPSQHFWANPRISPEGDVLYVDDDSAVTPFPTTFRSFTSQSDGTWLPGPDLPLPMASGFATAPTRAPQRHLLFLDASRFDEWVQDDAGTWQPNGMGLDLGFPVIAGWLSADGLRTAIVVQLPTPTLDAAVLYTDRATLADTFGTPRLVPTLPATTDLFITADCTRAYVSGANQIFYAVEI